jgi:hypothetical protein
MERIVCTQPGEDNLGRRYPDGGNAVVKMLGISLNNDALAGTPSFSTV